MLPSLSMRERTFQDPTQIRQCLLLSLRAWADFETLMISVHSGGLPIRREWEIQAQQKVVPSFDTPSSSCAGPESLALRITCPGTALVDQSRPRRHVKLTTFDNQRELGKFKPSPEGTKTHTHTHTYTHTCAYTHTHRVTHTHTE